LKGTSYDTRFLVELFYSSDRSRQEKIKDVLLRSRPNLLSTAALSELYSLTLQKEGREVAEVRANVLSKDFRLVDVDRGIAIQAAVIKHKHGVPFADSLIAATAEVLGVSCYSDDPHLRAIPGLAVKWVD